MLGWINDCIEKLVLEKFDVDVWHAVKEKAGCQVKDGGFLKLEHYPDTSTVALVRAASELSGLTEPQIYEAFGEFFVPYIINEGYENLLCCQGSTLRDWMTNINAIHQHLQTTFPKKMTMPEFWCEENDNGSLTLYYFSRRGNFLAPLAVGLVSEVARRQFELDIVMMKYTTQGVDGAKFTSWIVSTKDPIDLPKLRSKRGESHGVPNAPTHFKCPMSGMEILAQDVPQVFATFDDSDLSSDLAPKKSGCPMRNKRRSSLNPTVSTTSTFSVDAEDDEDLGTAPGGLSPAATRKLFPYHISMDSDFVITQVGDDLPRVLGSSPSIICGNEVDEVFEFVNPKPAKWTRSWMRKLEDQEIVLKCTLTSAQPNLLFKGTLVHLSRREIMIILCPDAKNLEELREMNLTLSDLPAHGSYRDAVFLREHLSSQMNNALKMEKLSRTLQTEKELLESLIPRHAAKDLRKGKSVKPMNHDHVTMFFSDVVGFTNICKHISPTEVIGMLNRLYGLMDYLADKFDLFKVETIGDAYVCVSGLPNPDVKHAEKVANFAIAVQHCCQNVLSPLDGSPIRLRIGIHSGSCASGIVGVTNPRYCVFGDTVNTTSRHESTGEAGKVHCSLATMMELQEMAPDDFRLVSRGVVDMKGKGEMSTYWLESSESNEFVNKLGLQLLEEQIVIQFKDTLGLGMDQEKAKRGALQMERTSWSSSEDREGNTTVTSSSATSTPSRKELAELVKRSSSGNLQRSRSRRQQRRPEQNISAALDLLQAVDANSLK